MCFGVDFGEALEKGRCVQCDVAFTLFRKKLKCSLCGLSSCDDCCKKKVALNDAMVRNPLNLVFIIIHSTAAVMVALIGRISWRQKREGKPLPLDF